MKTKAKAVLRRVFRFKDMRKAAQLPGAGEQRQAKCQARKEGFTFLCAGAQVVVFDPIQEMRGLENDMVIAERGQFL